MKLYFWAKNLKHFQLTLVPALNSHHTSDICDKGNCKSHKIKCLKRERFPCSSTWGRFPKCVYNEKRTLDARDIFHYYKEIPSDSIKMKRVKTVQSAAQVFYPYFSEIRSPSYVTDMPFIIYSSCWNVILKMYLYINRSNHPTKTKNFKLLNFILLMITFINLTSLNQQKILCTQPSCVG